MNKSDIFVGDLLTKKDNSVSYVVDEVRDAPPLSIGWYVVVCDTYDSTKTIMPADLHEYDLSPMGYKPRAVAALKAAGIDPENLYNFGHGRFMLALPRGGRKKMVEAKRTVAKVAKLPGFRLVHDFDPQRGVEYHLQTIQFDPRKK